MIPIGEYKKLLQEFRKILREHDAAMELITKLYNGSDKLLKEKGTKVSGYKELKGWLRYQHYCLEKFFRNIKGESPNDEGKNT